MKKLIVAALAVGMAGCFNPSTSPNSSFKIPPELSDCVFYDMYDGARNMTVVRCPRADVSVNQQVQTGQHRKYTTTAVTEVE